MSFIDASCFRRKVTFVTTQSRCQWSCWSLEGRREAKSIKYRESGTWNEFAIASARKTLVAQLCVHCSSLSIEISFLLPFYVWWKFPPKGSCKLNLLDRSRLRTSVVIVNWILCPQGTDECSIYGLFVGSSGLPIYLHTISLESKSITAGN